MKKSRKLKKKFILNETKLFNMRKMIVLKNLYEKRPIKKIGTDKKNKWNIEKKRFVWKMNIKYVFLFFYLNFFFNS